MSDDPILRGGDDEDDGDYPQSADLILDEDEDDGKRRRLIIIIIIIIIILLLLFCPVDRSKLKSERDRLLRDRARIEKNRPVGKAAYTIISGGVNKQLLTDTRKGAAVGVWFYVKNLSTSSEVLDGSMVKLKDQFGMEYDMAPELTEDAYELEKLPSPWGERLAPSEKLKVMAVFIAFSGPKKNYYLVGGDFDWTSQDRKDYEIGAFDTMPVRGFGVPDAIRRQQPRRDRYR